MISIEKLWQANDLNEIDARHMAVWFEISGIKKTYVDAGKTTAAALTAALQLSVLNNLGVPSEIRMRLLGTILDLSVADSWDQVFGPLKPKGKHKKPRKPLPTELDVWGHIYGLVVGAGLPLTVSTFEQAGEELGIGSRTCQNLYYSYANGNGLSLAGIDFSERSRNQARAARQAFMRDKDSAKN